MPKQIGVRMLKFRRGLKKKLESLLIECLKACSRAGRRVLEECANRSSQRFQDKVGLITNAWPDDMKHWHTMNHGNWTYPSTPPSMEKRSFV